MDRDSFYLAYLHANYCAAALLRAYAVRNFDQQASDFQFDEAMHKLSELAATLGFDMIKRVTADEAAALFHQEAA